MELEHGDEIPIEEREGDEIANFNDSRVAPKKVETYNPAFDVTPHKYITGFITEKGIIKPPFDKNFEQLFAD
jgi:methylthioribose-1-phosphate isomerase